MDRTSEGQQARRLARSRTDRVLTGVAGGLGEYLGIDPVVVRLAFVVLSLAGGAGIVAYLAVAIIAGPPGSEPEPDRSRTSGRQALAVVSMVAGILLLLREAGFWFGDGVVWPTALAVLGSGVIWVHGDESDRARWSRLVARLPRNASAALSGRGWSLRPLVGSLLVLGGIAAFVSSAGPLALVGEAPLAAAAAAVGIGVIAGPGVSRLVRQLAEERRERIRQEERAEVAAHLHDSVLQTLALIQRTDDPSAIATLARAQERELRAWLYGRPPSSGASDRLSRVMDRMVAEVERSHGRRIDLVMVGDCALNEAARALADALREATVNAAKHSGTGVVSVYIEVEPEMVTAYVRDQGVGFARAQVPSDRRGIAESIEGRMQRNGGVAVVASRPGAGTEVRLRMPRERG